MTEIKQCSGGNVLLLIFQVSQGQVLCSVDWMRVTPVCAFYNRIIELSPDPMWFYLDKLLQDCSESLISGDNIAQNIQGCSSLSLIYNEQLQWELHTIILHISDILTYKSDASSILNALLYYYQPLYWMTSNNNQISFFIKSPMMERGLFYEFKITLFVYFLLHM